MERRHVTSGTEWEPRVGYSRAVRVGDSGSGGDSGGGGDSGSGGGGGDGGIGDRVLVSGTTATDEEGAVVAPGDPERQTRRALENVVAALEEVGADVEDVVRTRLFVTDIDDWETIGEVHGEFFDEVRPAATMVEVSRLIDPELVVEIEAEAVVGSGSAVE